MQVDLLSPAYGEADNIRRLADHVAATFSRVDFDWRLLFVVNDNDPDPTPQVADELAADIEEVEVIHRTEESSYGAAVRAGLRAAEGEAVVPVMGDLADDIEAIPEMVAAIKEGYDVVYGSRFTEDGTVTDYPWLKLQANRLFNRFARFAFGLDTDDLSNGFSAYSDDAIERIGVDSLRSESFDVMVELKLLAHVHGLESTVVPVSWTGRTTGVSKFNLAEQGVRYGKRLFDLWLYRVETWYRGHPPDR